MTPTLLVVAYSSPCSRSGPTPALASLLVLFLASPCFRSRESPPNLLPLSWVSPWIRLGFALDSPWIRLAFHRHGLAPNRRHRRELGLGCDWIGGIACGMQGERKANARRTKGERKAKTRRTDGADKVNGRRRQGEQAMMCRKGSCYRRFSVGLASPRNLSCPSRNLTGLCPC